MSLPLHNRTALVTGAARGIGRACALELAALGASLVLVDDCDELDAMAPESGGEQAPALRWRTDFSRADELLKMVEQFTGEGGAIDILVNAKSFASSGAGLLDDHEDDWKRLQALNVDLPRRLIREVARAMVGAGRGGRIVSISSSSSVRADGVRLAYGCSKAALNALTRIAAAQLAQYDINVNAVAPGITRSPLQAELRNDAAMQAAVTEGPTANFFNRISEPEDVAAAVVFLCLPASRQITGQVIHTSAGTIV